MTTTTMSKGKKFNKEKKNFGKNKKKNTAFGKRGKKEFKPLDKRGRLVIRNLSFKCKEAELQEHFKRIGEVRDVQLLRRADGKLVGCGFVEFRSRGDADKAIAQLSGKSFLGRPIYIEKAVSRDKYDEGPNVKEAGNNAEEEHSDADSDEEDLGRSHFKEEPFSDEEGNFKIKKEVRSSDDEGCTSQSNESKRKEGKKDNKESRNLKRARLIVRNLSFKTSEEKLAAHFAQYGDVVETKLLRKPDNTLVGCGFVQFAKKLSAAKAIHHTSGKPFLGRPIIVDWAVAKDKFKKMQEEVVKTEIKTEDGEEIEIKKEDEEETKDIKKEDTSSETESDSEEESVGEEDEDDEDESDEEPVTVKEEPQPKRARVEDVDEGKTVFVKNLPFSADDTEFRECMEQFGAVHYALVCRDKFTEHSKGSGFVKFKRVEDAEKCLSSGTELTLRGTTLDPHPALRRSEAQRLADKAKEKKDNRNLYLVKEGVIMAGTAAARGVSVTDMERRLQLEQWKTTKLRNLNMFVSSTRLVVHNLPLTLSDKQLRRLFRKHAGRAAVIKEARVMRQLKRVDEKGQPVSKGYGFVSFERHEDALKALRNLNNNPDIFTPSARPIVSFSIENRAVINAKVKRMERSRQKNPLSKEYKPDEGGSERPAKKAKLDGQRHQKGDGVPQSEPRFAGTVAKPGTVVKMRPKYKLKNQAQQHSQDVRKHKRETKLNRQMRRAQHIKNKQAEKKSMKQKTKSSNKDEAFTKLIDKYKTKLLSQTKEKKKWYDE